MDKNLYVVEVVEADTLKKKGLKIHFVGFSEREQYDDWLDYDTEAALSNSWWFTVKARVLDFHLSSSLRTLTPPFYLAHPSLEANFFSVKPVIHSAIHSSLDTRFLQRFL